VYGENLQAGDADTNNFLYVHDVAISNTAKEVGFICHKMVDRDYRALDVETGTDYWSWIEVTYDNLSLVRSLPSPLFIVFAQKQGNHLATPTQLGNEACVQCDGIQSIAEVA